MMDVHGSYARDGYALIKGLLPRDVATAFLRQMKADLAQGGAPIERHTRASPLLKGDAVEVYGYHYPPMLGMLWGLTPTVRALTGRDLLPTYDYFRIYREGDILRVHSDRQACEHSLSLTLDYSDGVPWDLEVGTDRLDGPSAAVGPDFGGKRYVSLTMEPGDAVLYRGVEHRHGRMTPNANGWSAHLFLHWVERDGPYASFAFDGNADTTKPVNFSFS
ncbi:hypothetical protein [Sphingomonas sp. TF3]|uniref:hypothetical protein n=1 Tax=Sphingomonas sp. TF3 TaxID=2495580 RepID=UPI0021AE6F47|nr:hypothetical protein [Sphingomonas sp. TF3]